jgi:hypothetical protein
MEFTVRSSRGLAAVVLAAALMGPAFVRPVEAQNGGHGVFGAKVARPRAILGVWALHPYEPQFPEVTWTSGVGVAFSQWLFATFINSYDDRAFLAALERSWASGRVGRLNVGVGYRVGLVSGYDERLFAVAKYTPVLPFFGLVAWADTGPIGVDAFYVYRAVTLEVALRF